jgi:leucyl aminopeptidase
VTVRRLIVPLFQGVNSRGLRKLSGAGLHAVHLRQAERALREKAFLGENAATLLLVAPDAGIPSLMLLGLGTEKDCSLEKLRRAFASLARQLRKADVDQAVLSVAAPQLRSRFSRLGLKVSGEAVAMGWALGAYSYDVYKTSTSKKRSRRTVTLSSREAPKEFTEGFKRGEILAQAVNFGRDLSNTPANDLYPEKLAAAARKVAREGALSIRVLKKKDLERERMGALLGVAQGSARAPCMVVLQYRPRRRRAASGKKRATGSTKLPTLALVGKAITFDAGGLSIKPARGMEEMKFDMAGGAAVLGAMKAIARLAPRINVVAVVPATENVIGAAAMRPGDIIRSASGKTIEVINTDAEGRLILADALQYARRFQPDFIVDFATLTGACLVALGTRVSGLVTNHRKFGRQVFDAGERSGERVWELPLYDEFLEATKSQVADLKNSAGRYGGAITAGAFLSYFVGDIPWCHLDIAGTAWAQRASGCFDPGATGVGTRLAVELAMSLGE